MGEREGGREGDREGGCVCRGGGGGGGGVLLDWTVLRCWAPVMAGNNSEKVPITSAGPEDLQQFLPPVSSGAGKPYNHVTV